MEKKIIKIELVIEIEIEDEIKDEEDIEMGDLFNEVFWEVAEENGCTNWYEVFDSELWEEVCARIASRYGSTIFETDEFKQWVKEMIDEL